MAKPDDVAQVILDGITARLTAHKVKAVAVRAEPKDCRFCGHPYLEPCDHPEKALACGNAKLTARGIF